MTHSTIHSSTIISLVKNYNPIHFHKQKFWKLFALGRVKGHIFIITLTRSL